VEIFGGCSEPDNHQKPPNPGFGGEQFEENWRSAMSDDRLILVANPPEINELGFRNFLGESDYGAIATVMKASQRADHYQRSITVEDIAARYAGLTNCDPFTNMIMAEVASEMVGYVRGWWEQESLYLYLYKHVGTILPAWRRKGIGRAMLGWMEGRLKTIAEAHPQEAKKYFQVSVSQFQEGAAKLLESAGYQPAHYFFEMVRPDLENIPDFPLPDGLEIRPVRPEQYRVVWESMYGSAEEEWGIPEPTEEACQKWLKHPLFQPELWQIAWDKETAKSAGHVLTYINHEENRQFHQKRGYTEGVDVAREWRRRGLARALISRSLQEQEAAGMCDSALVVDSDGSSSAIGLYESCGFDIIKRDTVYRKPL
jgi:ribosomal protein S18 acetylase RimI-like enzyme